MGRVALDCLMDIHNQLERHDVTLNAFLVGQPELVNKKRALVAEGMHQLVGRFMIFEHEFRGITDVEGVRECLVSYDNESEYPEGSGWSYTRFFFPTQYERGFRLESSCEHLWGAFEQLHGEANLGTHIEIPMQYFTLAVQHVLSALWGQRVCQ